jgi:hypothetical protein
LKAHLKMLRCAKRGKLPAELKGDDAAVVLELKGLGYMDAIDTSSWDGPAVMDPKITLPGAQYLKEQSTKITRWALAGVGALIFAIFAAAALNWLGLRP